MSKLVQFHRLLKVQRLGVQALGHRAAISTSPKNRETVTLPKEGKSIADTAATKTTTAAANKNWVSYGFHTKDEKADRDTVNSSFFFSVTLCLVWGAFVWAYLPDIHMKDWSQREGYLELRRREAAGLEPICRDYVDPAIIELPSDEELGDTEMII